MRGGVSGTDSTLDCYANDTSDGPDIVAGPPAEGLIAWIACVVDDLVEHRPAHGPHVLEGDVVKQLSLVHSAPCALPERPAIPESGGPSRREVSAAEAES